MKDSSGLEYSTDSPEVINTIENFRQDLLSMAPGVIDILEFADTYETSLTIQSYCAALWLYGQTEQADEQASYYLKRARKIREAANEREALLFSSLEDWGNGKPNDATLKLEKLISRWPRDLVSMKFLEFIYYLLGQEYSGPRFLKALSGIYEVNKNSGYFLSSYSFALELCGQYDKALKAAEKAVEINEINPWAHHTISHVYLKKGKIDKGTKILEDYEYIWEKSGQAIKSHNNWHLALMYLENLDLKKAFSFTSETILKETPHLVIQQLDAISLLWRLEMGGFEVPFDLWKSIGNEIYENSRTNYIGFNSAHYIYALGRAGMEPELEESLKLSVNFSKNLKRSEKKVWEEVSVPLIRASALMAKGKFSDSATIMQPVINSINMVGGSDAQVDLFRQAYLLSCIKSGNKNESEEYLKTLSTSPSFTPLQEYWKSLI